MKADLVSYVYIDDVAYKPGDDVPKEVLARMGSHCFVDGVHPLGDSAQDRPASKPVAAVVPGLGVRGPDLPKLEEGDDGQEPGDDDDEDAMPVPPKRGAGSGKAAWAAYAAANGVEVGEATRDEIIDVLDAADVATA